MAIFVYYSGINGWYEGAPEGVLHEVSVLHDTDTIPATSLSSPPGSRVYHNPRGRERCTDRKHAGEEQIPDFKGTERAVSRRRLKGINTLLMEPYVGHI